jgi:hypothetical protein
MNRFQIVNLYRANGLDDFKLRSTEDLLKTHGINFKAVDGYNRLDDINKLLYEKFIINFFNAWGIESRATLIPKGIYFVEDVPYLVKKAPEDDCFMDAGSIVKAIDKNGMKTILHRWINEGYEHLNVKEGEISFYLRFEYEHKGNSEWLHVVNENTWY